MKTAACRGLLIFCLSALPLWSAAQTQTNAGRANGSSSVNTGLTGSGSGTGNSTDLGSQSKPQQLSVTGGLGGVTATPQVGVSKPAAAAASAAQDVTASQTPSAAVMASPPSKASAAPSQGSAQPGKAAANRPAADQVLQTGAQAIQQGAAAETAGLGEGAVRQALDRIFDASQFSAGDGPSGIPGSRVTTQDKIKKTVALANTASGRDAPDLYTSAVKTAEDKLPAALASTVKAAVLDYASRKAQTALPELANDAYQAAAAGLIRQVGKAFASFDKWETLLGRAGQPLVSNRQRLEADVQRVMDEGAKASAAGRRYPAPRIFFTHDGVSFTAVLPSAALAQVPAELAQSLGLKDAVAAGPSYQQALVAFQARPSLANGASLVYQAHRGAGRSTVSSAWSAADYGFRSFLARLWHALRDLLLRLTGRAPATGIGQGFTVEPDAALAKPARTDTVSLAGVRLQLARIETPAPAWAKALEAVAALQAEHAVAQSLLSRQAPLDLQTARAVIGVAWAMSANHAALTGEGSAAAVVRDVSRRLEQAVREESLSPRSPLPLSLARLISDPEGGSLRQWLDRVLSSGQEQALALSGRARANVSLSRPGGSPWTLVYLGEQPVSAKGRIPAAGLRAAADLLLAAPDAPQGSFAASDQMLLGRWSGPAGSGKMLALLAAARQGGGVRILYENPSGPAAAARLLSSLGFSVETRGQALSATLVAGASDSGGAALAQTLGRAILALQGGYDAGPAPAGAARAEAAAGMRKLVAELKRQQPQAEAVGQVLQTSLPEAAPLAFIGRVDGQWAQSGRLTLDDGRTLSILLLKDPESGLISAGRAELARPGKPQALSARELAGLLRGE